MTKPGFVFLSSNFAYLLKSFSIILLMLFESPSFNSIETAPFPLVFQGTFGFNLTSFGGPIIS
jgi:hypothetical protein